MLRPSPKSLFYDCRLGAVFPKRLQRSREDRKACVTMPMVGIRLASKPNSIPAEVVHCEMYDKFGWYHGSRCLSSRNTIRVRDGRLFLFQL